MFLASLLPFENGATTIRVTTLGVASTLSIGMLNAVYAECRNETLFAECRGDF